MSTNQINPNTERFRTESSDVSSDGVLGVLSAGQGGVTGKSTLAPLDLAALRAKVTLAFVTTGGGMVTNTEALALLDRVTAAESSLARYIVDRTRFGDAMAAAAVPAVVDAIMRELTTDSDKRAREATAHAEAAEAKIAAVRELHRPVPVYTTEAGDCEHGDDCESVEISAGSYCPVHTDGLTCDSCAAIGEDLSAGELPAYPCPTIAALDGTA